MKKMRINKAIGEFAKEHLSHLVDAVLHAEEASESQRKPLSGEQKLELAAEFVNELIDLPFVPEAVEMQLYKMALSLIVELVNRLFGRRPSQWMGKIGKLKG